MKLIKTIKKYLLKFDEWLLAKCQKFSDKVTETIGIPNAHYYLALLTIVIHISLDIVIYFVHVDRSIYRLFSLLLSIGVAFSNYHILERFRSINRAENEVKVKLPIIDSFRHVMAILALIICLTRTVGNSIFIENITMEEPNFYITFPLEWFSKFCLVLFFYFIACTGKPAQKGKVQERLEELQPKPQKAEAPIKYRSAS